MKSFPKILYEAFSTLFISMLNNETDNVELLFDFNKCNAKFRVELLEIDEKRS